MSDERHNFRLRIVGKVQGVGFRVWAEHEAQRLGLNGWIRNRSDGTVEAHVEGPAKEVEAFMGVCTKGPHGTQVERIDVTRVDEGAPDPGFTRRPTV